MENAGSAPPICRGNDMRDSMHYNQYAVKGEIYGKKRGYIYQTAV